jgi:hypothetical protein
MTHTKDEALKLALGALERYQVKRQDFDRFADEITAIKQALEQPVQEPVAWVPYLSDRADGVQGHYAIARWNPRGYREVWNLRRHTWGAFSDDVMSLEEADYLLQQINIPTRKPTPPAQPAPVQEPVAMRMPQVGDRVVCIEDESLGTVVYLTAGGSPEIKFDDGTHGTYMLREFAELFGYTTLPAQEFICSTGLCHYKAQRQWVGLSQDELDAMFSNTIKGKKLVNYVARAIEAKLKELNA